jgi:hypothetical protein
MASGQVMESEAMWEGTIEVDGVRAHGVFEVSDSRGGWEFLFGKPLQTMFVAVHDYKRDTVEIEAAGKRATLTNQCGDPWWKNFKPPGVNDMHAAFMGAVSFANTTSMMMCSHTAPRGEYISLKRYTVRTLTSKRF